MGAAGVSVRLADVGCCGDEDDDENEALLEDDGLCLWLLFLLSEMGIMRRSAPSCISS